MVELCLPTCRVLESQQWYIYGNTVRLRATPRWGFKVVRGVADIFAWQVLGFHLVVASIGLAALALCLASC